VGVVSHESNLHDNHTLPEVLSHIESSRGKEAVQWPLVCGNVFSFCHVDIGYPVSGAAQVK
jgi:hypothetical protein